MVLLLRIFPWAAFPCPHLHSPPPLLGGPNEINMARFDPLTLVPPCPAQGP